MRINPANLRASVSKPSNPTTLAAAERAAPKHPSNDVKGGDQKTSNPPIIDAEYVDFYSPTTNLFDKERLHLDNTLAPETPSFEIPAATDPNNKVPALRKYQLKSHEPPPPGSIIDTFA